MKKLAIIFAAALTVVMGCSRESFAPANVNEEGEKVVLRATVAPETRSSVSEEGSFSWQEGDTIGVKLAGSTGFTPFNLTDGAGTNVAEFTSLEAGVSVEKVAVMPHKIAVSAGSDLTLRLPQVYLFEEGRTNSPMVAIFNGTDAGGLEFKHICGLLAVTVNHIPVGSSWFVVSSSSVRLHGDFTIKDYAEEEDIVVPAGPLPEGKESSSLWIDIPEELQGTGPVTFYAPIPVGEYPDLHFGILDEYNYYYEETKCEYKNLTVERGAMLTKSIDNLDWDIVYNSRGADDGYDIIRFLGIPDKWQYTSLMNIEFNGNFYEGDVQKIIDERVKNLKASDSSKQYQGNIRISFYPFAPKQTFHIIAFQIDDDFNFTGNYIHRFWTPKEKEACSEGYNKWLGTWLATGKDEAGNDSTYTLTITLKSNDELYDIVGWAHLPRKLQAWYDATTEGLVIRTYMDSYNSDKEVDGITYHRRAGFYGATSKGFQTANNVTICTGTIDESGTIATLEGYTYYKDSPFVTFGYYYYSYEADPKTGKNKGWYVRKAAELMHFPITMNKVEIDN